MPTTYITYLPGMLYAGERTQSYTLGRIGQHCLVTTKLPMLYSNAEATPAHGDVITKLLG